MPRKKAEETKPAEIQLTNAQTPAAQPAVTTETPVSPGPATSANPEDAGRLAKKAGKIVLGLLVMLFGLYLIWLFFPDFKDVVKGLLGVVIILVGLIIVALGWTD